jgi:hypothetical protein
MRWLVVALLAACSSPSPAAHEAQGVPVSRRPDETIPAGVIDSHVHLAYYPVAEQLGEHGVHAAVDLASPESALGTKYPIRVIQSGPMLTRPSGYPLNAWGSEGYGIGCDSEECVQTTIWRLHREGARVIKIALDKDGLDEKLARNATFVAHLLRLKVVAHALTDEGARLAATIDVDVLAHTPLEPLSDATIGEWKKAVASEKPIDGMMVSDVRERRDHAVISTLAAFGGGPIATNNLRKLREAGLVVLYGTDLGNLRVDGPSTEEIELMKRAGMTDEEVRASMTTVPWRFWGFDAIEPR